MYKVIIFDLDGTLAESKQQLSLEMGEVLKKLLDKLTVGVMSGANFSQFEKQFLPFLPKDSNLHNLILFPTSAAECREYRVDSKEHPAWVASYNYLFTEPEKDKIIAALEEVQAKMSFTQNLPSYGEKIEDRGGQITWSALGQEAPLAEKEVWDPDLVKKKLLREELLKIIPEFEVSMGGSTSIDITHKDINKIHGIQWMETRFGINQEEMLYIGDALFEGGNDSVVKKTGILTKQVAGPAETKQVIEEIISSL